jgi:hypothetical protein
VEKVTENMIQKYYFEKCKSEQSLNGLKFAQSGHPQSTLHMYVGTAKPGLPDGIF